MQISFAILLGAICQAADGDLDPTYGTGGGFSILRLGSLHDSVNSLFALPDGSAIFAGAGEGSTVGTVVAKLTPDGQFDTNFGSNGLTAIPGSGLGGYADMNRDGSMIVSYYYTAGVGTQAFRLARILPDGSIDTSFGAGGIDRVPVTTTSRIRDVKIQRDGRVILAGVTSDGQGGDSDWLVARFEANGLLDTSFGDEGVVRTDFTRSESAGSKDWPSIIAIDSKDRIVVGGYSTSTYSPGFEHALARYLPNGDLDPSFGDSGKLVLDLDDAWLNREAVSDIEFLPGGDLLVSSFGGSNTALFKLRSDGSLANDFGDQGRLAFDFPSPFRNPNDIEVDSLGRILVAGEEVHPETNRTGFALGRLLPDGEVDLSFANGGMIHSFGEYSSRANALAIQPDGGLLVGGSARQRSPTDRLRAIVARFELDLFIEILLDIKPGPANNTISLNGNGTLEMAILSTDEFEVQQVDFNSLQFGDPLLIDAGVEPLGALSSSFRDIDHDGIDDLVLSFGISELADGEVLDAYSIEGRLTGTLLDGTPFAGLDNVRIVPKNKATSSSITSVPEPTSLALMVLGGLACTLRRTNADRLRG